MTHIAKWHGRDAAASRAARMGRAQPSPLTRLQPGSRWHQGLRTAVREALGCPEPLPIGEMGEREGEHPRTSWKTKPARSAVRTSARPLA